MFVDEMRTGEVQRSTRLEPSAKNLAYVLRHEELWPEGFEWRYYDNTGCAMGLAYRLWPEFILCPTSSTVADAIGINYEAAVRIFCYGNPGWFWFNGRTHPKQIAKALEKLAA